MVGHTNNAQKKARKGKYYGASGTPAHELLGSSDFETRKNGKRNIMLSVCSFIIVTEFCERLAYYGLSGSLTSYFHTNMGFDAVTSSNLMSLFSTVNFLTPMLGAYIAGTVLGCYRTILYCSCLYMVGMWMCVSASVPGHESTFFFLVGIFGFVCLGSGGIKSNVVVLGADQFDPCDPEQASQKKSFFNYFYWATNIGATFSYGYLAYLAVNGSGAIPREWGYFASFAIPASVFVLGVAVFIIGSPRYKMLPPEGSKFTRFIRLVSFAAGQSWEGRAVRAACIAEVAAFLLSTIAIFLPSHGPLHLVVSLLALLLIVAGCVVFVMYCRTSEWVDVATGQGRFSVSDVHDASAVVRLTPYLAFLTMFWAIYNQMSGNFVLQACQMDVRVGGGQYSGAQLSVMDSAVIFLCIPVFDRWVYPCFERAGMPLTLMRRIGAGFFLTALSMFLAAIVEIARRHADRMEESAHCSAGAPMSEFSIYIQVPQYILIGLGEILASITSYELFYSQVPPSMRSVCQGLNLLTVTLGGMVTTSANNVMASWITNDLNDGHLEYVFFLMAVLMLLNLAAFAAVARNFQPTTFPEEDGEEDDDEEEDDDQATVRCGDDECHYSCNEEQFDGSGGGVDHTTGNGCIGRSSHGSLLPKAKEGEGGINSSSDEKPEICFWAPGQGPDSSSSMVGSGSSQEILPY